MVTNSKELQYPVIFEKNKEVTANGTVHEYYVITSPNIDGMVTQADTMSDGVMQAADAIATMLDGMKVYPKPQEPTQWNEWPMKDNQVLVYIPVNMERYLATKPSKNVKVSIALPENILCIAKEQKVNISQVTREALSNVLF